MKLKRIGAPVALLAAAAISLTACAANEGSTPSTTTAKASNLSGTLNGIGSSAQGAAQTVWAAGFQEANPKATINYDPQGSGAGRKSFISGAADFAGSDAALKTEELGSTFAGCAADSKGIDLPVYISPIAIAYNVDGVKDLKLDAATIAGIFSGKITTWDDAKIKDQNSGASLPSAPITVVHRSDDSGTTQNFTEYLAANAPDVWTAPASQTFPFQVGDAAKGTSGVADATKNAKNSITYIDESGSAGLSIAQLKVGDNYEKISADGAAAVVAASPIAIAYNVDGVKDLKLDAATIAGIFSGAITTWNDPKIASQNSGASLPSAPITVVHRSDDSGTTQNFTEYLAANAPDVWTKPSSQTFPYTVGDAAKGTSGVADATKNAKNSITYIDESGSAGLSIAQLKVGSDYEKISADGAAAVVAASPIASGRDTNDLAIQIDRKDTKKGAWPLVLVSYVIACQQYKDAAKADLVKGYVGYIVSSDAQKAASEQAGSAPLASDLSAKVQKAVDSIK